MSELTELVPVGTVEVVLRYEDDTGHHSLGFFPIDQLDAVVRVASHHGAYIEPPGVEVQGTPNTQFVTTVNGRVVFEIVFGLRHVA